MTNRELELTAAKGRRLGMEMVFRAASGHIGGSFSAMDILTELYFEEMRIDPAAPRAPGRDRFVLSKGHCTPALYSILALRGYFPEKDLELFRSIKGHMSGHPDMAHVPGVDMSTGSLGQGISAAVGMAIAGKLDGAPYRVYALLGDGADSEGTALAFQLLSGELLVGSTLVEGTLNGEPHFWNQLTEDDGAHYVDLTRSGGGLTYSAADLAELGYVWEGMPVSAENPQ